MTPLALKSGDR